MKNFQRSFTTLILVLIASGMCQAQLVMTELMAQTSSTGYYTEEWIEIGNLSSDIIDLGGYQVTTNPSHYTFPITSPRITLNPGQYLVLHGRNQTSGYAQGIDGMDTNGTWHCFIGGTPGTTTPPNGIILLSNTGDSVGLYDNNTTLIDWVSYKGEFAPAPSGTSAVDIIDPGIDDSLMRCNQDFSQLILVHVNQSSRGQANPCLPTPTATPSPTATIAATHTPTVTKTPSATPTATPTPTITSTRTPTLTRTPTATRTPTQTATPVLSPCCTQYNQTLQGGWNFFAFQNTPSFGFSLLELQQQLLAQAIPVRYLGLWEYGRWFVCGPALSAGTPASKLIPPGTGIMLFCDYPSPYTFTYVGCTQ